MAGVGEVRDDPAGGSVQLGDMRGGFAGQCFVGFVLGLTDSLPYFEVGSRDPGSRYPKSLPGLISPYNL